MTSTEIRVVRRRNVDPEVARSRASKAGRASQTPEARYRALVTTVARRRDQLTDEQRAELRALLAPSGGASE